MKILSQILKPGRFILILLACVTALYFSVKVTQPDMVKLVTSAPKARVILSQLLSPKILTKVSETSSTSFVFPLPCGSAPNQEPTTDGPRVYVDPPCANAKDKISIIGEGLPANVDVPLKWKLPSGDYLSIATVKTDSNGAFREEVIARPITATVDGVPAILEAEIPGAFTRWVVSQTLVDVVDAMFVTIFMALLATTIGTVFALPLGFLAASNISKKGPLGTVVYYVVRGILNIIRSYEPLVMATVFALIVGFGSPFAGVLALVLVTTASLGKMFSESVESIDSGAIEAVTATGANRLQVIMYGVVPQIVPDFMSFTIYHWDINVRISTVIGFVGGGGIGYYLSQRINTFEYGKAGTALLAIVIIVWVLDFLSSEIRKRLI
jgi:phosphonate transport system permease protein